MLIVSAAAARTQEMVDYYAGKDSVVARTLVYSIKTDELGIYHIANKDNQIDTKIAVHYPSERQMHRTETPPIETDKNLALEIVRSILLKNSKLDLNSLDNTGFIIRFTVDPYKERILELYFVLGTKGSNPFGVISPEELEEIEVGLKEKIICKPRQPLHMDQNHADYFSHLYGHYKISFHGGEMIIRGT